MRSIVQRGRIVYLTAEAHARIMPTDATKFGKRPFLVSTTTQPASRLVALSKAKLLGTDAFLPKGSGLANQDCFADCASIFTVRDNEIHNVFSGTYLDDVMKFVDQGLRVALNLDVDNLYRDQL